MTLPVLTLPWRSLPFIRTPLWGTIYVESLAGVGLAQQVWTYPRYRYQVASGPLKGAAALAEAQTLIGFFNSVGARGQVFRFEDPLDGATVADQVFGTGDGTTTAFQLVRAFGGFVEPVFAVKAITNVKINGVAKTNPADYTIDSKGLVTFTAIPAAAASITWTGTYYWYCRFDQDALDFEQIVSAISTSDPWGPIWEAKNLTFSTIKFGA